MVIIQPYPEGRGARFVLKPHQSLSWRQVRVTYALIVIVCLGVAMSFAVSGLWLVLPFAGLEMLVLGFAFYSCAKRGFSMEVIGIRPDNLYIERGWHQPETRHEFKTAWTKINIISPRYRGHPSRLTIGSQGRVVEIGAALTEEERLRLAENMRKTISLLLPPL